MNPLTGLLPVPIPRFLLELFGRLARLRTGTGTVNCGGATSVGDGRGPGCGAATA